MEGRGKKEREEKFGLRLRFVIYDLYADGISFPVEVSWLGRSNFFFPFATDCNDCLLF